MTTSWTSLRSVTEFVTTSWTNLISLTEFVTSWTSLRSVTEFVTTTWTNLISLNEFVTTSWTSLRSVTEFETTSLKNLKYFTEFVTNIYSKLLCHRTELSKPDKITTVVSSIILSILYCVLCSVYYPECSRGFVNSPNGLFKFHTVDFFGSLTHKRYRLTIPPHCK